MTLEQLAQLGKDWEIRLVANGDDSWTLVVGRARMRANEPARTFIYRGALAEVIARAFHGVPPDDVGSEVE